MANEVSKAAQTAMSTEVMDDIFEHAGEGASFDSSEMQIPFVRLLQPLSPQVNKRDPSFIEGASSGDAFNNVTGQFWSGEDGINVVVAYQTTKYLEFVPREMGGGFKGEIPADSPLLSQTERVGSKEILPNGNELVKSDQHFVLVMDDDGGFQPAVVDMKSTQLKVSRRWKTQIAMQRIKNPKTGAMVTPPVFATVWHLTSVEESNERGAWNSWKVARVGLIEDRDIMLEAKSFRESIMRGEVRAAPEEVPEARTHDDDIPF